MISKVITALTLFLLLGASPADAQAPPTGIVPGATTATPQQSTTVLATVNIQDAKIVSKDGNAFHISFNLSNRVGIQAGVKYGVQLVSGTKDAQIIADEKVYQETLTLEEHSTVAKEIVYTAPQNLSGAYTLYLVSRNGSSFPLAFAFAGKVILSVTAKGLTINSSSCFLQVEGEKGSPHYTLRQGVDIAQNENLLLVCAATNGTSEALTAVPFFETHYRTLYGEVVPQTGGDTAPISVTAGEKKTFSITLPKASEPQAYDVLTTLNAGSVSSNSIVAHYVIRGASATVQSISLDKNYYQKGGTATLTFVWSPSADAFRGSRIGTSSPSATFAGISMTDGDGNACIMPVKTTLTRSIKVEVPLLLNRDCSNPLVSISLIDATGNALAKKGLTLVSSSSPSVSQASPLSSTLVILGILAVLGLGGGVYVWNRKKNGAQYMP